MKHRNWLSRIAALLTAVLLLPVCNVAAEGIILPETLENGDFQKDTQGWQMPVIAESYEMKTEGENKFLQIKMPQNATSPAVAATAGETYVWSFDVRSTRQVRGYVRFLDANGDTSGEVTQYIQDSPNVWKTNKMVATVPENRYGMVFMLNMYGANDGTICELDNVRVDKLDPTCAAVIENGDLENVTDGKLANFTVTGEGVSVTETEGYRGKAIKISTNEVQTVTLTTTWFALASGRGYDVSAFMNLTELSEDSTGICLEIYKVDSVINYSRVGGTDYFKKTAYADKTPMGWRKMLVPLGMVNASGIYEIRITFTGKGTVYVDDFAAMPTTAIVRNSDFEGFVTDYKPAGDWKFVGGWGEDEPQCVLRDTNGNHYLRIGYGDVTSVSGGTGIFSYIGLDKGARYVAEMDCRGGDYDCKLHVNEVFDYNRTGASANDGKDWTEDYRYYFTVNESKIYTISPSDRNGYGYSSFDNLEVRVVEDEDILTVTENEDTVTATFTGFGTDYQNPDNNKKVSVILARYLVTGSIFDGFKTSLDAFEILDGQAAAVPYDASLITSRKEFGEVPLVLPVTMDKEEAPSGASYKYKAFAVDASNRLMPLVHALSK